MNRIGIIGAGAWGTALACVAQRAGREVVIQAHEPEVARSLADSGENPVYLPGARLSRPLTAVDDPVEAVAGADAVLVVTPAQHLRAVCRQVAHAWPAGVPAVICAKGIEQQTGRLMSEAAAEELPGVALTVLSGPTFAIEVARGLPTAVTLAAADAGLGRALVAALGTPTFRIYGSADVVGAQVGGAVKNVLAIACGIIEGKGLGDNARAALVTRGLAEIVRLGQAKGARMETLMGLSGLGDLTLTCNAMQSRNFSLGVQLGQGQSLDDILGTRASVAEGVFTAPSVVALADGLGVDMPICDAINGILNRGVSIDDTIKQLLARPFKMETGDDEAADWS